MYKVNLFVAFIFAVVLIQCIISPDIRFFEPQPQHKKDLADFPNKYIGKYLSTEDSSFLIIDKYTVSRQWKQYIKCSKKEMGELLDTVFDTDTEYSIDNWKINVEVEDDSTILYAISSDTLFTVSENGVLRSFKGYLFMNKKVAESSWKVELLKLEKGKLDIHDLIEPSQIDSLKEVMDLEITVDPVGEYPKYFDLEIKRKHIKELLKHDILDSGYIKIE